MFDPRVHVGVAALVFNEDGALLIQKRSENVSHGAGKWSVPGGWVDAGESPDEAVLRELEEETGLISNQADIHFAVANTYDPPIDSVVCIFYNVRVNPLRLQVPEIMETDKCDAMIWSSMEQVYTLDLFDPLATLIEVGEL